MDYVIKNNNKVYIRVRNGRTETCSENLKGVFSEHKAKNILNSLPKTLRRYHFYVEAIPDIAPKVKENKDYQNLFDFFDDSKRERLPLRKNNAESIT